MSSIESRRNQRTGEVTWRVRYRHKGRNRAVTFTTQEAAQSWREKLDLLGHDTARGLLGEVVTEAPRTVVAQVRHHVEHLTGVEAGTRAKYLTLIDNHLDMPPLSTTLVTDLTRDHVAQWINTQKGAPKSIANRHALLSAALTSAERAGIVPTNVAKGIRLPRTDAGADEMEFLEPAEFATVLRELDRYWWPVPLLLVGSGIRWGEASALQVQDVDLARAEARIRQAWKPLGGGKYELGVPKTRRSRRTVSLSGEAVEALRPSVEGRERGDFVLTNRKGGPLRDWWRDKVWKPAVARAMPGRNVRVHDLRHTYAAWAIQDGLPLTVIQRQLGHESIQTTSDTYGHLVRSDFELLAAANNVRLREAIALASAPMVVQGEILH